MLIDEIDISFTSGHGGPGKVHFGHKIGADGGNGGRGGDVYISVTTDLYALNRFSADPHVVAGDGIAGGSNRMSGKSGQDVEVRLPMGTTLVETTTGETIDLDDQNLRLLICKGGLGGLGNFEFKSARHTTPTYAQPGLPGECKTFHATLKFIADYGLVGLPNAGKSSLLNELTNSKAAIGAYPFTTLEAGLGELNGKIIADIPGLIEGASQGKGLGIKFLKHIEKVKKLLHCISCESADVLADFHTVNLELSRYTVDLSQKPRIILLTKTDLLDQPSAGQLIKRLSDLNYPVHSVSVHDLDSITALKKIL